MAFNAPHPRTGLTYPLNSCPRTSLTFPSSANPHPLQTVVMSSFNWALQSWAQDLLQRAPSWCTAPRLSPARLPQTFAAPHHLPTLHPVPSTPAIPKPGAVIPNSLGTLRLCAGRGPRVSFACTTPPCPGLSAAGIGEFRPPPSLLRRTSRAPPRATRSPRPRAPHATAQ